MRGSAQRIRECLHDGPSTLAELADTLGMSHRDANVGICSLQVVGHIETVSEIRMDHFARNGRLGKHRLKLYSLTPRGSAYLKMKRGSK